MGSAPRRAPRGMVALPLSPCSGLFAWKHSADRLPSNLYRSSTPRPLHCFESSGASVKTRRRRAAKCLARLRQKKTPYQFQPWSFTRYNRLFRCNATINTIVSQIRSSAVCCLLISRCYSWHPIASSLQLAYHRKRYHSPRNTTPRGAIERSRLDLVRSSKLLKR